MAHYLQCKSSLALRHHALHLLQSTFPILEVDTPTDQVELGKDAIDCNMGMAEYLVVVVHYRFSQLQSLQVQYDYRES